VRCPIAGTRPAAGCGAGLWAAGQVAARVGRGSLGNPRALLLARTSGGLLQVVEVNLVAELGELTDQPASVLLRGMAPDGPVVAQVLVGHQLVQEVEGGDREGVGDGEGGDRRPPPTTKPGVLGTEMRIPAKRTGRFGSNGPADSAETERGRRVATPR